MGSPYKIRVSKQLLRHDVLSVEWMNVGSGTSWIKAGTSITGKRGDKVFSFHVIIMEV